MADENQTNLFDGGPEDEEQGDELTEGGDENEQDGAIGDVADGDCDDECEPEDGAKRKKKGAGKKGDQPAAASKPAQAPATTTAAAVKFTAPFNVRYAAEFLDLAGFTPGQAYTPAQVKQKLIENGYEEFKEIECDFHHSAGKGTIDTLVITIRGSRKGGGHGRKMPLFLLQQVEFGFRATFVRDQTEDRVLIYADEAGGLRLARPDMARTRGSVECDVELAVEHDGRLWDLVFDLHSHHELPIGAAWSPTDNANERIRGPIFGVFSWKDGDPRWRFRRFTGREFEDLLYGEVVTGV